MSPHSSKRAWHPSTAPQALLLLEDIRLLVGDSTGALIFEKDTRSLGLVLLEKGKICWASTPHTRNRLTGLLIERSKKPLTRGDVESVYAHCRKSGQPLLQALALTCDLEESELLEALCQHSVEALRELSMLNVSGRFLPHQQDSFGATYSFDFSELYVRMCSDAALEERRRAKALLRQVISEEGFALAFADKHDEAPLAVAGNNWLRLTDLAELSDWARSTIEIGGVLGDSASVVLSSPTRDSVLLWRCDELLAICFCPNDASLAYALTQAQVFQSTSAAV